MASPTKLILYHCTTFDKLKKILEKGLLPSKPDVQNQPVGVYLSANQFDWMDYVTSQGQKRGVQISVDATDLELHGDIGNVVSLAEGCKAHRGLYSKEVIPPNRFVNIAVETALGSCRFEEIEPDQFTHKT